MNVVASATNDAGGAAAPTRAPATGPALGPSFGPSWRRSGSFPRIAVAAVPAVVRRREEREVGRDALLLHADAVADEVLDVEGAAGDSHDLVGHVVVRA